MLICDTKNQNLCYNHRMKGLIIRKPWIDCILEGKKIWEIRGSKTNIRGKIELIQSGSGLVVGKCEIVDCIPLSLEKYKASADKHQISDTLILPYKQTYAWVIKNAQRYEQPKKYKHPNGAIIWVNL